MTLRDEIIARCSAATLATRNPALIAAEVSVGRTTLAGIGRADFAVWAAVTGLRTVIEDTAATVGDPLRATALTMVDFLRGGVADTFDMGSAANQTMLIAWVAMGKMTAAQKVELEMKATIPDPVTEFDVRCVMWDELGNWLGG